MARLTMSHGGDRHSDIVLRGTPGKLKIFSIHYVAQSANFPDVQQTSLLFRHLKRDFFAVPERVGHSSGYSRVAHKHKRRIAEYAGVPLLPPTNTNGLRNRALLILNPCHLQIGLLCCSRTGHNSGEFTSDDELQNMQASQFSPKEQQLTNNKPLSKSALPDHYGNIEMHAATCLCIPSSWMRGNHVKLNMETT